MLKGLFQENTKAPIHTIIKTSKSYNYWQLFGGFFYMIVSVVLFFTSTSNSYKIIIFLIFTYVGYSTFSTIKSVKNGHKIKLILNQKGIYFGNDKHIPWSKMVRYEFISRPNYSSSNSDDFLVIYLAEKK